MGKRLVLLLFSIFLISFVSAVPPVTTIDHFPSGFLIAEQQQGSIIYNHNFTYNFFLSNSSNGLTIDNSSVVCTFYLDNNYGENLYFGNVIYNSLGYWFVSIGGGNFSYIGEYPYSLNCENGVAGGSLSGTFYAGYSGRILDEGEALLYIPLFFVIFFLFFSGIYVMSLLPASNSKDEEGKIIQIDLLKYLRKTIGLALWLLFVSILFLSSNLSFAYSPDLMIATFLLTLFKIAIGLTIPIIMVWFVYIFAQIIDDKEMRKMLNRGMFPQGNV